MSRRQATSRILFICHGNICRSTMAQFVMQDLVNKAGLADVLFIDSAATTNDEIGHPPHHGTVDKLKQVGVPVLPHRARKVRADEYDEWDLFVYMDDENERHLSRIFGSDPETKCVRLLAFAPGAGLVGEDGKVLPDAQEARMIAQAGANAADVADPWFTGNFDDTYRDVLAGCKGLLTWCQAQ
ncbi:MAG: low molecular weight protein-tyrosine-phosphatase [Coriobacteriia bacterium]|nr:low molecular weight protein-tyrosine-phosphatase [Coriobacteriia bacterium]